MNPDFLAWSGNLQARIETALARLLPDPQHTPQTLHAAMRYTALGGGKRVRPLLAFAAGEVAGADPARVEIAACAVELIHAYSLVHDAFAVHGQRHVAPRQAYLPCRIR